MTNITIIGGGNLGTSIIDGLLDSGVKPENLTITRRKLIALEKYKKIGVNVTSDNIEAVKNSDVILLCIKPQKTIAILKEISPEITNQIVISTVTGISIPELEVELPKSVSLFRAMPNTAAAIRESMTCISTNSDDEKQKEYVKVMFDNLGEVLFIEDELMASATVLAASGIAFALRYVRAAMQGGIEIGFSSEIAQKISAQTMKGAASLVLMEGNHPESEIDKVTTPQGITITGLNKMEHEGLSSAIVQGILASQKKIENL